MDKNLEKLQQQARDIRKREGQTTAEQQEQIKKRRRRPSSLRILIWAVEFVILLAAFQFFILTPWLAKREAERRRATAPVPAGRPVVTLGDNAQPLTGLREVTDALLPRVDGLADGSRAAQDGQVLVSQEYGLPIEVENSVGMRFRLIPRGTFLMGSPPSEKDRWEGELQHVRNIPYPFYMGRTEVTQEQWRAVMESNPSYFKHPRRPVEEVTWDECQKFVTALCEKEGVPKGTYRLPLEPEWEYAGRAGTQAAYFFGNSPSRLRVFDWYNDNSGGGSVIVAKLRPNAFGLFDMQGNVWEWCQNLFQPYPGTADAGKIEGVWYAIRGGNWYRPAKDCRLAERSRLTPSSHGNMLGLRVVRMIPELLKQDQDAGK